MFVLIVEYVISLHVTSSPAEVVADDTPAVDAVLKADTKRLALLEEVCGI